jgi:hypothetical protein
MGINPNRQSEALSTSAEKYERSRPILVPVGEACQGQRTMPLQEPRQLQLQLIPV